MSRSPEQIQAEIERTRHQLANTLDELTTKASPKRLSEDAKAKVTAALQSPAGKAVIGVVATGVVVLVVVRVRRRHHY